MQSFFQDPFAYALRQLRKDCSCQTTRRNPTKSAATNGQVLLAAAWTARILSD